MPAFIRYNRDWSEWQYRFFIDLKFTDWSPASDRDDAIGSCVLDGARSIAESGRGVIWQIRDYNNWQRA